MTPVRLQLSRRRGFRLQELSLATNGLPAVKVDRTTRWGNPFVVVADGPAFAVRRDGEWFETWFDHDGAVRSAIKLFEQHLSDRALSDIRRELAGKNLCCWCKPGAVCHADALLAIANPKETP